MGCTHATSCPLFPKLQSSLAGWRNAYCDSESKWNECARYQKSLTGQPVPLALLPSGKILGVIADQERMEKGMDSRQVKTVSASSVAGGGVAVLTDREAEVVLDEASSATGRFFKRLKGLFGGGQ